MKLVVRVELGKDRVVVSNGVIGVTLVVPELDHADHACQVAEDVANKSSHVIASQGQT